MEWQEAWDASMKGRDTYNIIKKVDTGFVSPFRIFTYFVSGHAAFPTYLNKIKKRATDKCDCGETGGIEHYLFSNCPLMPESFVFDRGKTLR